MKIVISTTYVWPHLVERVQVPVSIDFVITGSGECPCNLSRLSWASGWRVGSVWVSSLKQYNQVFGEVVPVLEKSDSKIILCIIFSLSKLFSRQLLCGVAFLLIPHIHWYCSVWGGAGAKEASLLQRKTWLFGQHCTLYHKNGYKLLIMSVLSSVLVCVRKHVSAVNLWLF